MSSSETPMAIDSDILGEIVRSNDNMAAAVVGLTDLRHEFRLSEEDRRRSAHRYKQGVALVIALLLAVLTVGLSNRSTNASIRNCTEPGHSCSRRLAIEQAYSIRTIIDTDMNGIADIEEIRAKLENRPATTLPTLPPRLPVERRGTDWTVIIIGVLLTLGVGAGGQWLYIHWRLRSWERAAASARESE